MRDRAFAVAAVVVALAVLAPAAQAKELQANVVSMPSQLTPGEPVPIVLELYVMGATGVASEHPVVGAHDVAVVVNGDGKTHRFPAVELGRGRYAANIVFPASGDWRLTVAVGDLAPVVLGKGGVRIDDASSAAYRNRLPELPLMLAGAALLAFLHVRTRRP
jgi:hypothetical protein